MSELLLLLLLISKPRKWSRPFSRPNSIRRSEEKGRGSAAAGRNLRRGSPLIPRSRRCSRSGFFARGDVTAILKERDQADEDEAKSEPGKSSGRVAARRRVLIYRSR